MRKNEAQRSATRAAVVAGSSLSAQFLAMNAAATLIAGFGLLQDSEVVIIGAMLIAMLFGPIVGIALGLAEGDMALLGRSLVTEIAGAAWVLAIGFGVGLASRSLPIGSEILSRTSPNIIDLLVGLVGGIAGGYTYVSAGLTGVIVGVAIATSLAPPLTSCGILLAHHLPGLASGAFLLFVANFTAIAIGAMLVFWVAGHRPRGAGQAHQVVLPRLVTIVVLVAMAFNFTATFRRTIARSELENGIRKTMSDGVADIPGARVVGVTLASQGNVTIAWVVVRAPEPVAPQQVAHLNDLVNRATGTQVALHVRSVITEEATRDGYVYKPQFLPADGSTGP